MTEGIKKLSLTEISSKDSQEHAGGFPSAWSKRCVFDNNYRSGLINFYPPKLTDRLYLTSI
ncbi:hypothetical protein [Microcoleus sp. EPA2]|uniref:hypothetical protein n=1 Tax=Microcoleus sp. EPA2 TaxID=2841654 RepID=UPI00312BC5C4